MQQILIYGDSLSWGIIPGTRQRLSYEHRWPGIMDRQLAEAGHPARVIEDCLNGRRTVWEDPFKPGRNGLTGLAQRIEVNSPLALVILLLGTNDFQSMHTLNAWHAAQGVATLIGAIRQAPIEPGMPTPSILVVAPPRPQTAQGAIAPKFVGAEHKIAGLVEAYSAMSHDLACHFFDANTVVTTSPIDGVHLDAPQHAKLGRALAPVVAKILAE